MDLYWGNYVFTFNKVDEKWVWLGIMREYYRWGNKKQVGWETLLKK